MFGKTCPKCGNKQTGWISTTNEWEYVCDECNRGIILLKCDICGEEIERLPDDLPLCSKCELTARAHARLERQAKEEPTTLLGELHK